MKIFEVIYPRNIYIRAVKAIDDAIQNVKYTNEFEPGKIKTTKQYTKAIETELKRMLDPICQECKGKHTGPINLTIRFSDDDLGGTFHQAFDEYTGETFSSELSLTVNLSILGNTYLKFLKLFNKRSEIVHDLAKKFTHEIVHLIQSRKIPPHAKDNARNHTNVPNEIKGSAQYLGLTKEIEAHASMVANDLLRLTDSDQQKALETLKQYMKNPWTIPEHSVMSAYWTFLNQNKGRNWKVQNTPNPTATAWNAFCKKVYQHITNIPTY